MIGARCRWSTGMQSLATLPPLVDSWTTRLLQRRIEELKRELWVICAFRNGSTSAERKLHHFVRRVEAKYLCTPRHGERVAQFARRLGERLGLSGDGLPGLTIASLLHDIGKVGVPEIVLFRPGKRRGAVRHSFQTHPVIGADLLSAVPQLVSLAAIVRHHHERWDGKGYPDGLAGEAIPLGARIIAAADAFDALTAGRLYRPPVSALSALREIACHAGSQFDPAVASALVAACQEGDLTLGGPTCAQVIREARRVVP